jgi:hypothetical protein
VDVFFIVCLFLYCRRRSNYQDGVGIQLTGLKKTQFFVHVTCEGLLSEKCDLLSCSINNLIRGKVHTGQYDGQFYDNENIIKPISSLLTIQTVNYFVIFNDRKIMKIK